MEKHMNNLSTTIETIQNKIIKNINLRLIELDMTQQALSQRTHIAQPTISKLLTGKSAFSLEQLIIISSAIGINLLSIVNDSDFINIPLKPSSSIDLIPESDNLALDTTRPAFKGYLNNIFHIYFLSTVTGENRIINGNIEFIDTPNKRCKVKLTISTGKTNLFGEEITKEYTGNLIISIQQSTCYCILYNKDIAELSCLSFSHMYLSNEDLKCRMCVALTTSSGENRRPTIQRLIMSKYSFDLKNNEDVQFLTSQLRLNTKTISIDRTDLEEILTLDEYKKYKAQLVPSSYAESCILDENQLLALNMKLAEKINLINMLRDKSSAPKNNKIGTNTDEFLFEYISERSDFNNQ